MFEARLAAVVLAAAGLIGVAGCGGGSGDESAGAADLTLQLVEQNSSGQDGTATFTSLEGGRTRIVLELTNPPEVPQPAHVHSGTCDDLGDPVVALTSVEDGTSDTEVERSLEQLEQGDLVIHAHKSEAEYDVSVACAPIGHG
jgi:Cu/Zn superoxide dismutase